MSAPRRLRRLRVAARRGFFLLEMMIVLALLTVFALVVTRLLVNAGRLSWQAEADYDRILSVEAMTRRLRQDVWGASRIEAADGAEGVGVRLGPPDAPVVWAVAGDGVTRSVLEGGRLRVAERWPGLGSRVTLAPVPLGVELAVSGGKGRPLERLHLPSQILLLRREGGEP